MKTKMSRLKQGFRDITPVQLLQAKTYGSWGAFCGVLFAAVMTILYGVGYFAPWLGFVAFLQLVDIATTYKQLGQVKMVMSLQEQVLKAQKKEGEKNGK